MNTWEVVKKPVYYNKRPCNRFEVKYYTKVSQSQICNMRSIVKKFGKQCDITKQTCSIRNGMSKDSFGGGAGYTPDTDKHDNNLSEPWRVKSS